jgi:hypothetical protein
MQQEHGSRFRRGRAAAEPHRDGGWEHREQGEPRLDELLDDPMMGLLWRRDRLEPSLARAAVRALQALVRDGGRQGVGALGPKSPALAALGFVR